MALNGRRSLTLTEWQSLPLVAEWQAFTLFCCSFLRFAIKQSQTALPLNAIFLGAVMMVRVPTNQKGPFRCGTAPCIIFRVKYYKLSFSISLK